MQRAPKRNGEPKPAVSLSMPKRQFTLIAEYAFATALYSGEPEP